jgi:hypothetical protein
MIKPQTIRKMIDSKEWLKDPFQLLSNISVICASDLSVGRELVIRLLEKQSELSLDYQVIVDELAMQVGLYPYVSNLKDLSLRNAIQHAANRPEGIMEDFVLHSAQTRIFLRLMAGESIILSAPTSFGKSLLIDMVIASKDFQNIVLIVPTLALVEETRRRMSRFVDRYTVITSSNQKIRDRNLFVFTQERFLAFETEMPHIDFFVIDEFYKLSISEEGERSTQLNMALLKLVNTGAQFYLLGPSIKSIPELVIKKLGCKFLIEDFHTVAIELHYLSKKPNKGEALAKLLDTIDGQTMVYCQSPSSTRKVLKDYLERRDVELSSDEELIEAAEWTAKNYHDKWLVSIALSHGIGIHHGKLPRSLGRFMVRAFEEGKLNILFCTSTLIEGVNTAAKNVVIYDEKLNKKPLDYFTYNNIRGRSGRMFRHFIGRVFVFSSPPAPELPFVDIPSFNPSNTTPSSLLIQMPFNSLPKTLQLKVNKLLNQNLLPIELLKLYSSIEPEYLLDAAEYLIHMDIHDLTKFSWSSRPQYENILASSEVIWNQLNGAAAAKKSAVYNAKMMTYWIWKLYRNRSVSNFREEMIGSQIKKGLAADDAVENVLSFLRGWASFNYPKYLTVLSGIANWILNKRGLRGCDYSSFAVSIEHLFQPETFSSLEEYGLPFEISQKMLERRLFSSQDELDKVVSTLRRRDLSNFADGVFEKRVIEDFQQGIGAEIKSKQERK